MITGDAHPRPKSLSQTLSEGTTAVYTKVNRKSPSRIDVWAFATRIEFWYGGLAILFISLAVDMPVTVRYHRSYGEVEMYRAWMLRGRRRLVMIMSRQSAGTL